MSNIHCNDCDAVCISGVTLIKDGMYTYDDQLICGNCLDHYFICTSCDDLFPRGMVVFDKSNDAMECTYCVKLKTDDK